MRALTKRGPRRPSLLDSREAEGTHNELILGLYLTEDLTVSFSPVTMVEPLPHVHQAGSQHTGIAAPPQPGMETLLEEEKMWNSTHLSCKHLLCNGHYMYQSPDLNLCTLRWHAPLYFQGQQTWNPS